MLDSANFVLSVPQGDQILRSAGLQLQTYENTDGAAAAITVLKMASLDAGWGLSDWGTCSAAPGGAGSPAGGLDCSRETKLLSTATEASAGSPSRCRWAAETSIVDSFALATRSPAPEPSPPWMRTPGPMPGRASTSAGCPA